MAGGGPRSGRPGVNYPIRSDLQTGPRTAPAATSPTQQYGSGARREAQIAAAPMNQAAVPPPPGSLPGLGDPSLRPDEPVTAGLPDSPGPGPEALVPNVWQGNDPDLLEMKALYRQYPYPGLRRMIERAEAGG